MAETLTPGQLAIEQMCEVTLTDTHWRIFQSIDWDLNKSDAGYQYFRHDFLDLLLLEMRIRGAAE